MSAHDRAMIATSEVVGAASGRSIAIGHVAVQIHPAKAVRNTEGNALSLEVLPTEKVVFEVEKCREPTLLLYRKDFYRESLFSAATSS